MSKDYVRIADMNEFRPILQRESVLFSAVLSKKHMIWFTKTRYIILTETRIIHASSGNKTVRFVNNYAELLGVTKSLRVGSNNFIMHFGTRADEEVMSDHRDELISILATQHEAIENRAL